VQAQHSSSRRRRRWHNDGATPRPLLLCLPQEVLRTITHNAGKEACLACAALRTAHGAPASSLTLAISQDAHLSRAAPMGGAPLIDSRLGTWLQPGDVTQLRALSFLPATTCEALAAALPNLRAVTLLGGMHSATWLRPHATTRLLVAGAPWQEAVLPAVASQHFAALRSLTVTGCDQRILSNLSPVGALLQLTSLTLAADLRAAAQYFGALHTAAGPCAMDDDQPPGASRGSSPAAASGSTRPRTCRGALMWPPIPQLAYPMDPFALPFDLPVDLLAELDPEWGQYRVACVTLHVWEVLAGLPRLARLCLDVPFNYHSDMPAGARPLGALTHLAVRTDLTMTTPDTSRGVEVPFLQVWWWGTTGMRWCGGAVVRWCGGCSTRGLWYRMEP
jgi:hypothetical protein